MANPVSLLVLATFTWSYCPWVPLHAAAPAPPLVGAEAALTKLQEGNQRFSQDRVTQGKPVAARRAETAQSQHPFAIIVACADSRTAPELLFDQNIGDLFVVRTAGHLVGEHALGSIEYAVEHLGTRLIVILGHERCGAVTAALASRTAPGNINSLVRDIQPAVQAAHGKPGDALANTICEHAKQVTAKVRAQTKLQSLASEVRIVTGIYDLDTGVVEWLKD
jgi:carbonic anhydrase